MGSGAVRSYLLWLNVVFALAIVVIQEYLGYWPHDAINYILSGGSIFNRSLPASPIRQNLWAILAGPIALIHPFFVRLLGVFLFFLSAYMVYRYLVHHDRIIASWFMVLVTLPTYALWIAASGLSEPLAYLFAVLSFIFWLKYVESDRECFVVISAVSAVLAFFVRAPLALIWVGPALILLARRSFRILTKIAAASLVFLLAYAGITYLLFGSPLPSQFGMLYATSSRGFNASPLWYSLFVAYPFLVFGVLVAPILLYAYWHYRSDRILRHFLLLLLPYFIAMLFLAPKEPRYATVFIYPSAYVLARLFADRLSDKWAVPIYILLVISSFWVVPGVSMHVEYEPYRHWVLDVPSFIPALINDAFAKVEFARSVCARSVVGYEFIQRFYSTFYHPFCQVS